MDSIEEENVSYAERQLNIWISSESAHYSVFIHCWKDLCSSLVVVRCWATKNRDPMLEEMSPITAER